MAGHEQHLESDTVEIQRIRLLDEKVRRNQLYIPVEPELPEEPRLGEHFLAVAVVAYQAAVFALDSGGIPHVVDVAVREQQRADFVTALREPSGGVLRRIDEDSRRRKEEAICVKNTTGEEVNV